MHVIFQGTTITRDWRRNTPMKIRGQLPKKMVPKKGLKEIGQRFFNMNSIATYTVNSGLKNRKIAFFTLAIIDFSLI
jgi:hypothetical protein